MNCTQEAPYKVSPKIPPLWLKALKKTLVTIGMQSNWGIALKISLHFLSHILVLTRKRSMALDSNICQIRNIQVSQADLEPLLPDTAGISLYRDSLYGDLYMMLMPQVEIDI